MKEINPFDIVSGKTVQNENGTFWFKEPGNNVNGYGWPIEKNLHRDNDLPAVECANGDKEWWVNGDLHRDNDLPASIWANGTQYWYKNGKRHRENDLPAVEDIYGGKEWWEFGRRHRHNGLPAITGANGTKRFFYNSVEYYPNISENKFYEVK